MITRYRRRNVSTGILLILNHIIARTRFPSFTPVCRIQKVLHGVTGGSCSTSRSRCLPRYTPASSFTLAGQQLNPIFVLIATLTSKREQITTTVFSAAPSAESQIPSIYPPTFADGEYRDVRDACHLYFQCDEDGFLDRFLTILFYFRPCASNFRKETKKKRTS